MEEINIDELLHDLALDDRILDGIVDFKKFDHIEYLAEHLQKTGVEASIVEDIKFNLIDSRATRLDEGKYPERQAYNKDGLLVTFPTPDYKARAIARGTHFEQNPVKPTANVFQTPPAGSQAPQTPAQGDQPSQLAPTEQPADPSVPQPTASPAPDQAQAPAPQAPPQGMQIPDQVIPEPPPLPEVPKPEEKTEADKKQDSKEVEQILKTEGVTGDVRPFKNQLMIGVAAIQKEVEQIDKVAYPKIIENINKALDLITKTVNNL